MQRRCRVPCSRATYGTPWGEYFTALDEIQRSKKTPQFLMIRLRAITLFAQRGRLPLVDTRNAQRLRPDPHPDPFVGIAGKPAAGSPAVAEPRALLELHELRRAERVALQPQRGRVRIRVSVRSLSLSLTLTLTLTRRVLRRRARRARRGRRAQGGVRVPLVRGRDDHVAGERHGRRSGSPCGA